MRLLLLCILSLIGSVGKCWCQESVSGHVADTLRIERVASDSVALLNDTAWTAQGVKDIKTPLTLRYALRKELTWAGLPWVVAGIAIRGERRNIRELRHQFQYNFHNTSDDYSQYAPLLLVSGLKLAGVKGHTDVKRYAVSSFLSLAIMATLVNSIKYSVKEMRPDGTTRNSFPSGHTATAFAAATILHKEYGLTRSPWYSLAGYALATATGCMRILNNRHWVSDTFAGAGLGILSTELGYTIADLLFKEKGIVLPYRITDTDLITHPSFFNVQVGVGVETQSLDLFQNNSELQEYYEDMPVRKLRLSRATTVGAEGAYFLNRYVGVGGRMRIISRKAHNCEDFVQNPIGDFVHSAPQLDGFINSYTLHLKSNHLSEFSMSGGVYFNYPLSSRVAIGSKLLVGRSYLHGIDIRAEVTGRQRDIDITTEQQDGRQVLVYEVLGDASNNGKEYTTGWSYLNVEGSRAMTLGTGVSLTLAHKSMIAWKIFADYDFTRRTYSVKHTPTGFMRAAARNLTFDGRPVTDANQFFHSNVYKQKKSMSNVVFGAAFVVTL